MISATMHSNQVEMPCCSCKCPRERLNDMTWKPDDETQPMWRTDEECKAAVLAARAGDMRHCKALSLHVCDVSRQCMKWYIFSTESVCFNAVLPVELEPP